MVPVHLPGTEQQKHQDCLHSLLGNAAVCRSDCSLLYFNGALRRLHVVRREKALIHGAVLSCWALTGGV